MACLVTENAAVDERLRSDDRGAGGEHDQRVERPGRRHPVERIRDLLRIDEQHRALAEVVEHQRRHREAEPCDPDRPLAEVAHVGVERLGAGDAQHDRAERHERDARVREQEHQRVVRRERFQDRGVVADVHQPEHCEHREPQHHHRPEELADALGAVALEQEQGGQHDQRDRHDPAVEARCRDLQSLDRGEDGDGGRDDAVAEEDRGAEDADEEQPPAQRRPVAHRRRREREHRDQAALAVVVGAQDQHDVLDRDDDRQRPEHQRQHAVDVAFGERHVAVGEHFLQRVERAGADVAVDDADRAERQRDDRGGRPCRRARARDGAQICTFVPSSTTRFGGRLRKSDAEVALRCMLANSFSRQCAMPGPRVGTTEARDRK